MKNSRCGLSNLAPLFLTGDAIRPASQGLDFRVRMAGSSEPPDDDLVVKPVDPAALMKRLAEWQEADK